MEISCDEIQLHLTDFIIITMTSGVGIFLLGYMGMGVLFKFMDKYRRIGDQLEIIEAVHIVN